MAAFDHREMFETLIVSESVKVRYKDESRGMRQLGRLLFWNPAFMTNFSTTFGATVWLPSRKWVDDDPFRAWVVLCHELVHVEDYTNSKPRWLFPVMYSMPQGLAVLAVLAAVFQIWWLLGFLVLLAPLPAPWRKNAEMRGYAMSMAATCWVNKTGIPQAQKEQIARWFTGPDYYFMWPFKGAVQREVGRWSKMILCNEIFGQGDVYARVHKLIKARI
jgi:hypothetical protein